MPSLFESEARDAFHARIARLRPDSRPRWGRLTAPRMLRHVGEALRHGLGELEARPVASPLRQWPVNWLVIHVLPWPRGGAASPPEFLARPPREWQEDLEDLHDLIRRFGARGERAAWPVAPVFGRISGRDWGVLAYRHLDHHLTQFGV